MALGFSGSNGGVDEAYRRFVIVDIESGISKYGVLRESAPEGAREMYDTIIANLKQLKEKVSELEIKVN